MKLAIMGAGEQAEELYGLIMNSPMEKDKYEDVILVDLEEKKDKRIISEDTFCSYNKNDYLILVAVGEPYLRNKIFYKFKSKGYKFAKYVHESAVIVSGAFIEEGAILFPFVYISPGAQIGSNVLIHSGAKIENNCIIGAHCFISLGAFVGASTMIGKSSFVGPNASIKDRLEIGEEAIVGMGSCVINSVDDNNVVVGNPARIIRENSAKRVFARKEPII